MLKNKTFIVILFLVAIASSYLIGRYSGKNKGKEVAAIEMQHEIKETRESGYRFISPLLECSDLAPSSRSAMIILEKKFKDYIARVKAEKKVSHVSIYFRDLSNGPWIGVGENEPYSPASLLKVPIMIAALKKTESEPGFLHEKITYKNHTDDTTQPNITDHALIQLGNSYTVDELINQMIAYSDNEAKNLLLMNIDETFMNKVYSDLGIDVPGLRTPSDFMSVKDYSAFFRILYNATYLNKQMSEKALEYLSKTDFKKGLPGKLPKDIIVSHKFGERGMADSNVKQLHDCGIIYKPEKPYILCVMTRGSDFDEQAKVISEVSLMVFENR